MNKAESSAMEHILSESGWTTATESDADLIIINTCTVRATAENRAWSRIRKYAADKKKRKLVLMVVGCMAEQYKDEMKKKVPAIDYVLGTFQKQIFGLILEQIKQGTTYDVHDETPSYVFSKSHHEPGSFRAFVPIMHGCNNFCTYCIVPYVRGREVSRNPLDILAEIDSLDRAGVREITLLGQNVNSYAWKDDEGILDFPGLLQRISGHLKTRQTGIGWIRFLTSHPKDLSERLIQVIAEEPLMCRHVHLCIQSGSNRVLSLMNRKYTKEYFLELVDKMKASIPGLSLSTDILVGFPSETEEDLQDTLDVMRKVEFTYSFMYHFNPREGTPAVKLQGKVPEAVKKERLSRVIELQKAITSKLMQKRIGQCDLVLIEDQSKKSKNEVLGRTARDEMVVFKADVSKIGTFATVRLIGISGNTFKAEEVNA